MTAIIILNWNGWRDTVACLDSLLACPEQFMVCVADNGSTDQSVERLKTYISEKWTGRAIELLENKENYGFAKGNNEAIRHLMIKHQRELDSVLLLNNDTVVSPDWLSALNRFREQHPDYDVLTPLICYYSHQQRVWNAGGKQAFGMRKYNYPDCPVDAIKETGYLPVTFVTGCALWVKTGLLKQDNRLFTERFFFGEEDFEFCLRMNKRKKKMACVLDSVIYHKVSASTIGRDPLNKIHLHYLNRYIDMRLHSHPMYYFMWSRAYAIYIMRLLRHLGYSTQEARATIHAVRKEAQLQNRVTKDDYDRLMK